MPFSIEGKYLKNWLDMFKGGNSIEADMWPKMIIINFLN